MDQELFQNKCCKCGLSFSTKYQMVDICDDCRKIERNYHIKCARFDRMYTNLNADNYSLFLTKLAQLETRALECRSYAKENNLEEELDLVEDPIDSHSKDESSYEYFLDHIQQIKPLNQIEFLQDSIFEHFYKIPFRSFSTNIDFCHSIEKHFTEIEREYGTSSELKESQEYLRLLRERCEEFSNENNDSSPKILLKITDRENPFNGAAEGDWKKSEAHLELLSRFVEDEDLSLLSFFAQYTNEPYIYSIGRFIREGLMCKSPNVNKLARLSGSELSELCRENGLPVSGAKLKQAERLIRSLGQREILKLTKPFDLYRCTEEGLEIAKKYLESRKIKLLNFYHQVGEQIKSSNIEVALNIWGNFCKANLHIHVIWSMYTYCPKVDLEQIKKIQISKPLNVNSAERDQFKFAAIMYLLFRQYENKNIVDIPNEELDWTMFDRQILEKFLYGRSGQEIWEEFINY